ncbi:hypothetical protein ABMA28_005580 [Loxostege sticticalis]|uniref:Luciferase n=1 Tax=Loxostege sticticalis TaxID=481309 RepID=A0ABD0SM45_LOXSC
MLKNKLYVYGDDQLQLPAHLQYGKHLFQRIKTQKDKTAIINAESGETLSYRELTQKVVDIALSLTRVGIKKGDVVGICSEKNLDFIPTVLAIACVGATITLADVTSDSAKVLHRLKLPNLKLIFCSGFGYDYHKESFSTIPGLEHVIVYGDQAREGTTLFKNFLTEHAEIEDFLPVPVEAEDPVIILYTSGTTGSPKGVLWTNKAMLMLMETNVNSTFYKDKVVLVTREWCYPYALTLTLCCMAAGATVVYCPKNDTNQQLEAIQAYKVQIIQLTPSTLSDLVTSPIIEQLDVSSVEMTLSSATSCNPKYIIAAKTKFPNLQKVCQLYGSAEMTGLATDQNAPVKYGSAGIVGPGLVIKVVDLETRKPLGPNKRGEVCVKSVAFTPRYVNSTSTNHLDEEGFFKTGDVAYYEEDGYIFFHPAVHDAGVVGAPHKQYGEVPTAFVVSNKMRLEGGIRFVEQLPRIYGDKLDRKALKLLL